MELEKIREIISDKMDIDPAEVTEESSFEDMHLDSLDLVEVIMDIEEAFDITVDTTIEPKNVGDLIDYIKEAQK